PSISYRLPHFVPMSSDDTSIIGARPSSPDAGAIVKRYRPRFVNAVAGGWQIVNTPSGVGSSADGTSATSTADGSHARSPCGLIASPRSTCSTTWDPDAGAVASDTSSPYATPSPIARPSCAA